VEGASLEIVVDSLAPRREGLSIVTEVRPSGALG